MNISKEDLEHLYDGLVDAELQRMLASGNLTELAQSVALRELKSRGIKASMTATVTHDEVSESENSTTYVSVAHQLMEQKAQVIYGLLEAHDIPAQLQGSSYTAFPGQVGNFAVLVPEQYAAQALSVISEDEGGGFELEELSEVDLEAEAMALPPAEQIPQHGKVTKQLPRSVSASKSSFKTSESYGSVFILLIFIFLGAYAATHLACKYSSLVSLEILKAEC